MKDVDSIETLIALAESLEAEIANAAQAAGKGPVGLALNTAKTQIGLGVGALLRAQRGGSAVGSGPPRPGGTPRMKAMQLHEILFRIARHGNTSALVEHARAVGATVLVGGSKEAQRLNRDAKVSAISIDSPPERFVGLTVPIVVDPSALHVVARAWTASEDRADRAGARAALADRRLAASSAVVSRLSRQLVQAQDEIADLREQLAADKASP